MRAMIASPPAVLRTPSVAPARSHSTPFSPSARVLGIDFGTSNSAMAWRQDGGLAQPLKLEGEALAMPTALFFNSEDHRTHFGRDAVAYSATAASSRRDGFFFVKKLISVETTIMPAV